MKTSGQIADDLMQRQGDFYTLHEGDATTYGIPERDALMARRAMIRAIETDRQQRPEVEVIEKVREYAQERARYARHPRLNTVGSARIASDLCQILGLPYPGTDDESEKSA